MLVGSWLSFLTHLLSVVVLIRIPRGAHGRITVKVTVIVSSIAWQKERSATQCRVEGERKRTAGSESDERSNKYFFLKKARKEEILMDGGGVRCMVKEEGGAVVVWGRRVQRGGSSYREKCLVVHEV